MADTERERTGFEARCVLRAAREGTLAGNGRDGEGPHAALVTPATMPSLAIVLLLSGLSRHTRALEADPLCALLVSGPPVGANPQARPRLTVQCRAERVAPGPGEEALRARYLAVHPYAGFYAALPDFRIWRLVPSGGLFVAGFGRAVPIRADQLCGGLPADEAPALRRAAQAVVAEGAVVGADGDGIDLARGEGTVRLPFARPIGRAAAFDPALLGGKRS